MHDRKPACFTVFLLALTLAFPRLLTAQSQSTSALTGTVTDSTGAVIPGATVSITSPSLIGGALPSIGTRDNWRWDDCSDSVATNAMDEPSGDVV